MQSLQDCLQTLNEVIISQQDKNSQHEPTSTEYFAVIIATISSGGAQERLPLLLKVLAAVVPSTAKSILRSQFKPVSLTLINIIKGNKSNSTVVSNALTTLGKVLAGQETSDGFWDGVEALQSFNILLSYLDEDNSKLRKIAHEQISSILQVHTKNQSNSLRSYFTEFSLGVIKSCTRNNYKRAFSLIVLLESTLIYIPSGSIRKLIDSMIKLQACEIHRLTAAVYRSIDSLFQTSLYPFELEMTYNLLNHLLNNPLTLPDIESQCHYYNGITSGLILLYKRDVTLAFNLMPKLCSLFLIGCDSDYSQVHCAIASNLKRYLQQFFLLSSSTLWKQIQHFYQFYQDTLEDSQKATSSFTIAFTQAKKNPLLQSLVTKELQALYDLIHMFDRLLQFKYQHTFIFLLDTLRTLIDQFRGKGSFHVFYLYSILTRLIDINQSIESQSISVEVSVAVGVTDILGHGLQCLGLPAFLQIIALVDIQENPMTGEIKIQIKEWLLALFLKELRSMSINRIADFMNNILPIAGKIHKLIQHLIAKDPKKADSVQIKQLRNKIIQLWSLFPEICAGQLTDIDTSFVKINGLINQSYQDEDYPELAFFMTLILHRILKQCLQGSQGLTPTRKQLLINQSAVIIPLLLKYIERLDPGDGKYKETLACLTLWLSIAPETMVTSICKKLIQLVLINTTTFANSSAMETSNDATNPLTSSNTEKAVIWMAILLGVVPYMPVNFLPIVYKTIRPLLSLEDSPTIQKRAYQLLSSLLQSHMNLCFPSDASTPSILTDSKESLLQLLHEQLFTTRVSSRMIRLHCISLILQQLSYQELISSLQMFLSEYLLCIKDSNKKARETAMDILRYYSKSISSLDFLHFLCSGLIAETPTLRAATINAILLHIQTQKQCCKDFDDEQDELDDEDDEEEEHEEDDEEGNQLNDGDDDESLADNSLPPEDNDDMEENNNILSLNQSQYPQLIQGIASLLPSITLLITQDCHDQTKSCLLLLKYLLSCLIKEEIAPYLSVLIPSFTSSLSPQAKHKFLVLTRNLLRKLLRKFDAEELRPHVPPSDYPLLDYLLKQQKKQLNKKKSNQSSSNNKQNKSVKGTSEMGMEDMEDGEEGHEEDYRYKKRKVKAIRSSQDLQVFKSMFPSSLEELVDENNTYQQQRKIVGLDGLTHQTHGLADKDDERFNIVVNSEGKLTVKEREVDLHSLRSVKLDGQTNAQHPRTVAQQSQFGGSQKSYRESKKRKLLLKEPGIEYRAKKAGGDVWKKGTLQPHAYIPLDPRLLSKKHHQQAVEHFGTVIDHKNPPSNQKNKRRKLRTKR